MRKFSFCKKTACSVFVLCAATSIPLLAQTLTTLHSFNGTDGSNPTTGLVQGTDGNFYGTTVGFFARTVFKISPEYPYTLTTLHTFDSTPSADLVQGTDGNFYGTTDYGGGAYGSGMVFKINPQPPYTVTTLYSFCSQPNCIDGTYPEGGLVQGTDGNFYGTTLDTGAYGSGTVFKITPGGTLTTLYSFCSRTNCTDGANPYAGLVQSTDGNFYGTTGFGGANSYGTVFKMTPSGTLTTLYSFCSQTNCADGNTPYAGLVQGTDGNFYGATGTYPSTNSSGTVFKITPSGTLTTLYSFCSQPNCTDGGGPSELVQATDGNFYGTTDYGGAYSGGTVFKINTQPPYTLTTLYSFCSQTNCTDGTYPAAGLVQGTDGNFYGTTLGGGTSGNCSGGCGTVFTLSGPNPTPVQFVPVTPCRLLDTRPQYGGNGPIQGGTFQTFDLPQLAQTKGCADLSSAAAYSLNIAVVPSGPLGYLTVWPTNGSRPGVATLNSLDGRIKANAAIVRAGSAGAVSVYVTNTTNVIIDIDGYFAPVTEFHVGLLSADTLPRGGHAQVNFPSRAGSRHSFSGQTTAGFPSAIEHLQHTEHGAGVFAELGSGTLPRPRASVGISGSLAERPDAGQSGFHAEQSDRNGGRQRCHRAAGTGGDITVYPEQRHRPGDRYQRLLCPGGTGWAVALSVGSLPRHRHPNHRHGSAVQRIADSAGGCSGQPVRSAEHRAGVRLQRYGGTLRRTRVSDIVAERPDASTGGFDLERAGRCDHQQHGDRAYRPTARSMPTRPGLRN